MELCQDWLCVEGFDLGFAVHCVSTEEWNEGMNYPATR